MHYVHDVHLEDFRVTGPRTLRQYSGLRLLTSVYVIIA
jgi:hypothetical protein